MLKYESWAVVMDNNDSNGNGYKILEKLKLRKYKVVVISDFECGVDGIKTYSSLEDVPHNIDVVGIIDEGMDINKILDEIELLDIKNIWFEKNTYNESILKRAKDIKLNIQSNLSLYQELRK